MIPEGINRSHVLAALADIVANGVPHHRQSADYDLVHDGQKFPPKYVISVAGKHALGAELRPDEFAAGNETNLFLRELGFDVVARERGPVPEVEIDEVRRGFARLLPDDALRRVCAEIMADAIEFANGQGSARWEVTFKRQLIRLNGGRVLIFDLRPEHACLVVDPSLADPSCMDLLSREAEETDAFALLPTFRCFLVPYAVLPKIWPGVRPAFQAWVEAAARTARRTSWSYAHTPAVVDYVAELTGRALPQPIFDDVAEDDDEKPRTFWVNQGRNGATEMAGGYLFAHPEDTRGAKQPHRQRIKELRPGDRVVHYAEGAVRAVSRVTDAGRNWSPDEQTEPGWRVAVEVCPLDPPIDLDVVRTPVSTLVADDGPFDRNGEIKQGYLWPFGDGALEALRGLSGTSGWPAWAIPNQRRYWIFQGNPEIYDVRKAITALDEIHWRVKQHRADIRVDDTVFLWESGAQGGVLARARVMTLPAVEPTPPAEVAFYREPPEEDELPTVRLRIERRLDAPLASEELRAEPVLSDITLFTSPQRTNVPLTERQGALLERWVDGERPQRIVKIAPGEAGRLWSDCLANGYVRVGWDEVGDLRQYPDWSSFRRAFAERCERGKNAGHVSRKAGEVWTLARLRPGDRIVANKGISRILGVGTVTEAGYGWRDDLDAFKHTVAVAWDVSLACDIPPVKRWGTSTVDKVPATVVRLLDQGPVSGRGTEGQKPPPPRSAFAVLLQSLRQRLWLDDSVVAHYLLALQTKRFVILTGVSGTGKTQIALAVAKHFEPRVRKRLVEPTPAEAARVRVSTYMLKYRRVVLPAAFAVELSFGGQVGSVSTTVDVEFPGGAIAATIARDVRSSASSVTHLLFKGELREWFEQNLKVGDEFFIEHLESKTKGRDRLRLRVPAQPAGNAFEETVTVQNYEVIPVRPDWTDGRSLLGFYNAITGRYEATPFLRLMLRAADEERRAREEKRSPVPFFAILDEMNLARVEQYFSDFLSALESGQPIGLHDGELVLEGDDAGGEGGELSIPKSIMIPGNLFFTGTVNVDETTFMFSPKVLDRAFVIEFNDVDLRSYGRPEPEDSEADDAPLALERWSMLVPPRAVELADWDRMAAIANGKLRERIVALNDILATENRQFGYRVANEIARFLCLASEQSADPENAVEEAFDLAVFSKVLPKLHGTQQELEPILIALFCFSVGATARIEDWQLTDRTLEPVAAGPTPVLPRSSLKLWRMIRRVRAQGFTSFIE